MSLPPISTSALDKGIADALARATERLPAVVIDTLREQWKGLAELDKQIAVNVLAPGDPRGKLVRVDGERELHRCLTRVWDGPRSAIRSIHLKASASPYRRRVASAELT